MAEACEQPGTIWTASSRAPWIDANFYIWIGHRDDRRGWDQLAAARQVLDERRPGRRGCASSGGARRDPDRRRQRLVLVVRRRPFVGPRSGVRRPVPAAPRATPYRLLGISRCPTTCSSATSRPARPTARVSAAVGLVSPSSTAADGELLRVARRRRFEVRRTAGAMHQIDAAPADRHRDPVRVRDQDLFVRLDGTEPMAEQLRGGLRVHAGVPGAAGLRIPYATSDGRIMDVMFKPWTQAGRRGSTGVRVAARHVLELGPVRDMLGLVPGMEVQFFIASPSGPAGPVNVGRYPEHRPVTVTVPDDSFAARTGGPEDPQSITGLFHWAYGLSPIMDVMLTRGSKGAARHAADLLLRSSRESPRARR